MYIYMYNPISMDKIRIKQILKETFSIPIKETEPKAAPAPEKTDDKKFEKDYKSLQDKLSNSMLKQNQVFAAAGLGNPKDATDRSLWSKKLRRETNDEGGVYQFNQEELASIMKVVNNPSSYLSVKKH